LIIVNKDHKKEMVMRYSISMEVVKKMDNRGRDNIYGSMLVIFSATASCNSMTLQYVDKRIRLRAYGTKTELYSCSRHITHKFGIARSLLAPSDKLSSISPETES
jgi:hypothetical protein